MGKKIYVIALTLITIACVCYGAFKFTGGFSIHKDHDGFYFTNGYSHSGSYAEEEMVTNDDGDTTDIHGKIGPFHTIEIDARVMDVQLQKGESYQVTFEATEKMVPTISEENGVLTIKQKSHKNLAGTNNCKVVITVPDPTAMESINAIVNVGDVKMNGFVFKRTTIETDVGDIKLERSKLGDCELTTATGDIKVIACEFDCLSCESSVGDVEVSADQKCADFQIDCVTDVGEVSINQEEYGKKAKIKNEGNEIRLRASVGDISLDYEE